MSCFLNASDKRIVLSLSAPLADALLAKNFLSDEGAITSFDSLSEAITPQSFSLASLNALVLVDASQEAAFIYHRIGTYGEE